MQLNLTILPEEYLQRNQLHQYREPYDSRTVRTKLDSYSLYMINVFYLVLTMTILMSGVSLIRRRIHLFDSYSYNHNYRHCKLISLLSLKHTTVDRSRHKLLHQKHYVHTVSATQEWIGSGTTPTKFIKRKCALVVGYVGSNYTGLQLDEKNTALKFIEGELRDALVRVSAISEANSMSLSKIDWSRSSRTDKGVHASKVIISMKLEIPQQWLDEEDSKTVIGKIPAHRLAMEPVRFKLLVDAVNMHLPSDIRVFSCLLVNNRFNAKEICKWRAYKYILPASMLTMKVVDPTSDAVLASLEDDSRGHNNRGAMSEHDDGTGDNFLTNFQRFNTALIEMQGCHSFHNYNKLSARDIKRSMDSTRKQEFDRMRALNTRNTSSSSSSSEASLSISSTASESSDSPAVDDNDDDRDDEAEDADVGQHDLDSHPVQLSLIGDDKPRHKPYGDEYALHCLDLYGGRRLIIRDKL